MSFADEHLSFRVPFAQSIGDEGERVKSKVYYFGCDGVPGHYMISSPREYSIEARRADHDFCYRNPWGASIDGGLCPKESDAEGRALLHHKDGWTALSFWDRSVDRRGGCNSNFLAEGELTFAEMMALAWEHFPQVMGRFRFEITPPSDALSSGKRDPAESMGEDVQSS